MYKDTENRFILERYHAGGANRYVCPQCGRKKCFTRYVDRETGEYVADECGKCIIRKTKCSTIVKRNDIFSKRNVYFFGTPPLYKKMWL